MGDGFSFEAQSAMLKVSAMAMRLTGADKGPERLLVMADKAGSRLEVGSRL